MSSSHSTHGTEYPFYQYQAISTQGYPSIYTAPQPQQMNPGFESYSYPRATHQDFVLDTESIHQQLSVKPSYQAHSPAHSPTHSSANSFDLQPPVLSSTSDSGASIQSNMSSAMGSPSLSIHAPRDWNQMQGTVPGIVQQDCYPTETFTPSGFDYESAMALKHPGFVGESRQLPSSRRSNTFSSVNSVSSCSSSFPQSSAPVPAQRRPEQSSLLNQNFDSASASSVPSTGLFKQPESQASSSACSIFPLPTTPPASVRRRAGSISYSPFFAQSSGTSGAPLEFSCLFPPRCAHFLILFVSIILSNDS